MGNRIERRVEVRNAGSERQVRAAERREVEHREMTLEATRATLATQQGRAFIWSLLTEANVYASVWADHGSRMAFNVGQQDFGHFILATCLEADESLTQTMEREGRSWQARTNKPRDDEDPGEGAASDDT